MATLFQSPEVEAAFRQFTPGTRRGLLRIRELIFEEAAALPEIGRVEECLKWGQPAYWTPDTRSASTLRLGEAKSGAFAIFVHCQSSLIPDFEALFPGDFEIQGTRALCFEKLPAKQEIEKIRVLIRSALTYHRRPKSKRRRAP